jgi:hypothetical protein
LTALCGTGIWIVNTGGFFGFFRCFFLLLLLFLYSFILFFFSFLFFFSCFLTEEIPFSSATPTTIRYYLRSDFGSALGIAQLRVHSVLCWLAVDGGEQMQIGKQTTDMLTAVHFPHKLLLTPFLLVYFCKTTSTTTPKEQTPDTDLHPSLKGQGTQSTSDQHP